MPVSFAKPTNARDMVKAALREHVEWTPDQTEIEITNIERHPDHEQTIIAGTAVVNNTPWAWEINYGIGQGRLAVFDELEVRVYVPQDLTRGDHMHPVSVTFDYEGEPHEATLYIRPPVYLAMVSLRLSEKTGVPEEKLDIRDFDVREDRIPVQEARRRSRPVRL